MTKKFEKRYVPCNTGIISSDDFYHLKVSDLKIIIGEMKANNIEYLSLDAGPNNICLDAFRLETDEEFNARVYHEKKILQETESAKIFEERKQYEILKKKFEKK